jgi:hypothetical protein
MAPRCRPVRTAPLRARRVDGRRRRAYRYWHAPAIQLGLTAEPDFFATDEETYATGLIYRRCRARQRPGARLSQAAAFARFATHPGSGELEGVGIKRFPEQVPRERAVTRLF